MSAAFAAYVAAGFGVGTLTGLTGIGGGSLMTPLLILVFGIHPSMAIGTDLLFAALTKTAGAIVHGANRNVDWRIVGALATGSLPGAALALALLRVIGVHGAAANHVMTLALGVMLLFAAAALAAKPLLLGLGKLGRAQPAKGFSIKATVATGFLLGILVAISSIGAGALGTIVLLLLYPSLPMKRIVGSDIAHAVPLTLLAGLGHWWLGSVDFGLLAPLLAGSLPGIVIGSIVAQAAPERLLRILLAGALLWASTRLLLG